MANTKLGITIDAQNNASGTIQKVKQDIQGLDRSATTASGGLGAMGKALGVAGLVAFGAQVGRVTIELAQLGAQSLALKGSFEQVAGGADNARNLLEGLRSASAGMISDTDLMLAANRAMLLGVANSADEMSQLLQIAAVRGRAMGLSVTQAFNDIVTGLGRQSPLILDNLGITVDAARANEEYAASIGKTASALSETERKAALVNAVIKNSADLLSNAGDMSEVDGSGFAQLNSAWTNFRTAIGESIAPFLDARAKEIATFVKNATDSLNEQTNAENFRNQISSVAPNTSAALAGITDTEQVRRIFRSEGNKELSSIGDSLGRVVEEYRKQLDNFIEASRSGNSQEIAVATTGLQSYGQVIDELARKYNTLAELLGKPLVDLQVLTTGTIAFEGLATSIGEITDATRPTAAMIEATNEAIRKAAGATNEYSASFEKAASILQDAEPKMRGIYDTLLNTGDIEGAGTAYSQISGIIQEITAEWVRQGIPIETISNDLVPKLISEIDKLVGSQVESGAAGQAAGESISSGFLSTIPSIQLVIEAVNALTGAANVAGGALGRATETGRSFWRPNTTGNRDNARGIGAGGFSVPLSGLGRGAGAGAAIGGLGGALGTELSMRNAGIGGRGLATDLIRQITSGGGGGGTIDSALNSIASRVKSVLSGALKSGINLDEILGRQDAVEEPARRLADIAVRGFDSPWTDYIRNTFPEIWKQIETSGDPKGAAASILRDFEAGLRPELLDKDRAKELVKRAITGDQNMAQLAQEIAQEIAQEMGISLEQAQAAVASTLGTGDSSGIGATFGDGAVEGVKTSDTGSRMVSQLVSQLGLKDNLSSIYTAGQTYGSQWGSGFLASVSGNVPGALIAVLVAAVTPGVQAAIATQGSRTGATGGNGGAI